MQSALCVNDLMGLRNGRGSGRLAARNRPAAGSPGGSPLAGVAQAATVTGRLTSWARAGPGIRLPRPAVRPTPALAPVPLPFLPERPDPAQPPPVACVPNPKPAPQGRAGLAQARGSGPRAALGWVPAAPPQARDQDPPSSVHGDPPRGPCWRGSGRPHWAGAAQSLQAPGAGERGPGSRGAIP